MKASTQINAKCLKWTSNKSKGKDKKFWEKGGIKNVRENNNVSV